MISSEKNSAGPTSCADSTTTRQRSAVVSTDVSIRAEGGEPGGSFATIARSRCLCMFSIITIAASIIAPIAIAMPPSDMMSAPTGTNRIAMNAISIPTGSVRIATSAELACKRNTMHTIATMIPSSTSLLLSVAIARSIRLERSYTGRSTTPCGNPGWISARRAFTFLMVVRAFCPNRITTMPPTASPRPSYSATPRRTAGPTYTRPSSATRIGVPDDVAPTTMFSMSASDLM